jgi:LPXTG-site transpeptidase (sortase) family protein
MSKRVEKIFWVIAVTLLAAYVGAAAESHLYQFYLDWRFAEMVELPRPAPNHALTTLSEGQALGRLEIPSIHLSAMIAEGVDSTTLRRSIGHVPGTALPGTNGNVSLSAHRDSYFRWLGKLRKNDVISITTLAGTFDYVVESTSIVEPDELAVLRDVGRPTLTLVTCYPFYYVGPAPRRFIVHAGLIDYGDED